MSRILPICRFVSKKITFYFAVKVRIWLCRAIDAYRRNTNRRNAIATNRHYPFLARHKIKHLR